MSLALLAAVLGSLALQGSAVRLVPSDAGARTSASTVGDPTPKFYPRFTIGKVMGPCGAWGHGHDRGCMCTTASQSEG